MKSFHFTAKNQQGEKIDGIIQSHHFEEASQELKENGFEILALQEVEEQIVQEMRPFVFEALDQDQQEKSFILGEDLLDVAVEREEEKEEIAATKPETIRVPVIDEDEEGLEKTTEEKKIENIQEQKTEKEQKTENTQMAPHAAQNDEPILFKEKPSVEFKNHSEQEEKLDQIEQEIENLLHKKSEQLSESTQARLKHLAGKLSFLRESPDKKRFKNLQRELRRLKKAAEKEIKRYEQARWEEYEKKTPKTDIEDYEDFEQEIPVKKEQDRTKTGFAKWFQIIDEPHLENEKEVLIKQQYESVWSEAQRFMSVLFAFYLVVYFIAYYLKRAGIEDQVLVRIFDATLYKQVVLILFVLFAILSIRKFFLPKRIKSDAVLLLLWLGSIWLIFS